MLRSILVFLAALVGLVLLLPVYLILAAQLAFVSAVRLVRRLFDRSFVDWSELVAFDSVLGWRMRPNLDTCYLAEHDDVFRMVTDGEGWAGRASIAESEVVVVGDSFAAGYGIDAGRSFADLDPRLKVKAIGAPGYSMVHGVLLMEQLASRLAGKLVVWFVYLENDLQDNLAPEMRRYRAPFLRYDAREGAWGIVNHHLRTERWRTSNSDVRRLFPRFCVPGPLADRAYSACDYLIARAKAACLRAGAELVVVTIPHPMQLTAAGVAELAGLSGSRETCDPDLPDRRIADCCRRHEVAMLAAKAHLSRAEYQAARGHPLESARAPADDRGALAPARFVQGRRASRRLVEARARATFLPV